jgi:hypothetical protein
MNVWMEGHKGDGLMDRQTDRWNNSGQLSKDSIPLLLFKKYQRF